MRNTTVKTYEPMVIREDITSMENLELSQELNNASYNFCTQQDFDDATSLTLNAKRLEELMTESLTRVFEHNNIFGVQSNKIYETIEKLFDNQLQYDSIKAISALRRMNYWSGIEGGSQNEKYLWWFKARIKRSTQAICNKVEHIAQLDSINHNEMVTV